MKIMNGCSFMSDDTIELIEKKYDAKYVFETCIKNKSDHWYNFPVAIFYTEEKHPEGSNYFAIYKSCDGWMIADGITAIEEFDGVKTSDGVYYSRYRHDYRNIPGGFVDGGRDYLRWSGDGEVVRIKVVRDRLELAET